MTGDVMTCALCGGRPYAKVAARWVLKICMDAPLQNNRLVNAGAARWGYKKERAKWEAALMHAMSPLGPCHATQFRRVTFERCYAGKQRICDLPNLVGGLKTVLDAMVRVGLLVDDSPDQFEGHFRQRKVDAAERGTLITIEELA